MSDSGKAAAIAELRREVGFGCPVCRSPFLTWHHFDPPVSEGGMHWNVDGIIAMCPLCHPDADKKGKKGGAYSKDELRTMKRADWSVQQVRARFPTWERKRRLLVRMGGVYADTDSPLFSINETPQLQVAHGIAGILELSFVLRDKNDVVLVEVDRNWLTTRPANIYDMTVTPETKHVKVWIDRKNVGLDMVFGRITMDDLRGRLARDANVTMKAMAGETAKLPAEIRAQIEASLASDPIGPIGNCVLEWAQKNCVDDEGMVPFLNIETMALWYHGHSWRTHNGIAGFLFYSAAFNNKKGAINVGCPCLKCAKRMVQRP